MKLQIIKNNKGQFWPRLIGDKGFTFGAWNGLRDSYEVALKDLNEYKQKHLEKIYLNQETVLFEEEIK